MRRRGSSKQRLRLGSGGYLRRGGRGGDANTDTYSHCHTDRDAHRYSNGISDSYAATIANAQVGAKRQAAPHASAQVIDFAPLKISGDPTTDVRSVVVGNRQPDAGRATVPRVVSRRANPLQHSFSKSRFVVKSLIIVLTRFR
jgi:hypothetical protein